MNHCLSKRILYVTHEPFWPVGGGGTAGTFHVVNSLAKQGFEVVVFSPLNVPLHTVPLKQGIRLNPFTPFMLHRSVGLRNFKYLLYSFLSLLPLKRLLAHEVFDAVIVHNAVMAWPVVVLRKQIIAVKALRYTDFLSEFLMLHKGFWASVAPFLKKYEIHLAKHFERVFVVTDVMKKELLKTSDLSAQQVHVIYDGVDTGIFNALRFTRKDRLAVRQELGVPSNAKIVLFHGALEKHHPLDNMARIIEAVSRRDPSVYFVLIGMGHALDILKRKIQLPQVVFLSAKPYSEIPRYVYASDAGIIPYPPEKAYTKILTLKLLEYLSLGLPCVSFNLDGIKEVFGSNNFLKISSHGAEFVDNIFIQLSSEKSQAAQECIAKTFSWEAVAKRIAAGLFQELKVPLPEQNTSIFQMSSVEYASRIR
jgi:glycosyltransferase involved in cell wall biosynthesis